MQMSPLMGVADEPEARPVLAATAGPAVEEVGVADQFGFDVWTAMRPAVATAIDRGEDGERFAWRSGSGTHSGIVQPVAAYFGEGGSVCRRLAITVTGTGAGREFLAEACRGEEDSWRVTPLAGHV